MSCKSDRAYREVLFWQACPNPIAPSSSWYCAHGVEKNFGFNKENILSSKPPPPPDFITLGATRRNTNICVLQPIGTSLHGVISHIRT